MYEEMKKRAAQEKTVRETVDPEFEAAFKKLNLNRLFAEFNARPMRSQPEELHENVMIPVARQKMNKRDLARMKFVQEHRRRQHINKNFKNKLIMEREKFLDIEEGTAQMKRMTYKELVEDMN